MMDFTPIFILAIIFTAVYLIIKVVSDNRIRRQLIESGKIDEHIKYLYTPHLKKDNNFLSNLKWGLVLIGLGAALFIGRLFPYEMEGEGTMGLMFLFAGLAFFIYYFVSKKEHNTDSNE
jgi:CDP-diglyceride synthetase